MMETTKYIYRFEYTDDRSIVQYSPLKECWTAPLLQQGIVKQAGLLLIIIISISDKKYASHVIVGLRF